MDERNVNRVCMNCKWRSDGFMSACINDESEHLADYVDEADTCPEWEAVKDETPLPCPFCGGEAIVTGMYQFDDVVNACVLCLKCGANLNGKSHREAVGAWNKRSGGLVSREEMERGDKDDA